MPPNTRLAGSSLLGPKSSLWITGALVTLPYVLPAGFNRPRADLIPLHLYYYVFDRLYAICKQTPNSITYVALTESYRLYVLRRRQSLYRAFLDGRLPPVFSFKDMVQHRFASLKCWLTGRYLNVSLIDVPIYQDSD